MNLKFIESDLEQWAQLSSDRNPIHFDEVFAKKNGLDGCIVHGMLAMLPMKEIFTEQNKKNSQYNHIKIFLKKSVPLNKELSYSHINNKIMLKSNDEHLYSSKITYLAENPPTEVKKESIPISSFISKKDLKEKYIKFKKLNKQTENNILFWDSILFSIYISNNKNSPLSHNVSDLLKRENLKPESYVVFQIEHSLTIFNNNVDLSIENIDCISYSLIGGDLIRIENNIYASIILYLYLHDKPIIKTEMGLLAKLS